MKFVIQRVKQASVKVEGSVIGEIEKGYLVLIGVSDKDTEAVADKMIKKMIGLRIFEENQLYEYIIEESKKSVSVVQTGRFGAEMEVSLINDGPFTILLDSEML